MLPPGEVMAWTYSVNKLPTLGFPDVATRHGHLCGILESAHEQGFQTGSMIQAILRGMSPANQPPRLNEHGIVLLNLCTAEKLHMDVPYAIIEAAGVVTR